MSTMRATTGISRRAFSMLELAVVLGIIALIAGAGMTMATGGIKAADRVSTQERLATIKLALDSYGKTYGYLPCPANRTLGPTNVSFGLESRSGASCTPIATGVVQSGLVWLGALPVRTLGLPDNYGADAWNGKLSYAVSSNFITNTTGANALKGNVLVRSGSLTASHIVTTEHQVITAGTASNNAGALRVTYASTSGIQTTTTATIASTSYKGTFNPSAVTATTVDFASIPFTAADTNVNIASLTPGTGAAYAVVSHGPDGLGAFTRNGATVPAGKACSATTIDGENCNDNSTFFDSAYNDGANAALFFDDYIVYGSFDWMRPSFNPALYTGATSNCPTGTCETWCAACTRNFPGGGAVIPPVSITSNATLCRKVITSSTTDCTASCFWGGFTAAGYSRCP